MSQTYRIAHELDRVVRQMDALLHQRMVTLDTNRIGQLGGFVLLTLSEMQPSSIHRLCARMGRDNSQMTRVVKALEHKGMVARASDPDDGRVALLRLTDEGTAFVDTMKTTMSEVVDHVVAPLTPRERDRFLELLLKLTVCGGRPVRQTTDAC